METEPSCFPRDLLAQVPKARLNYFQTYIMAHPRLVAAKDSVVDAIEARAPNSLVLLVGPTGVGKTALRQKVEQVLTSSMLPDLQCDRARIPVVSLECKASESGSFKWRDHFRRLLLEMQEPLVDYKLSPKAPAHFSEREKFIPAARAAGYEYHHAVECALRFRRPAAVLLDEAQHLARMASGRRLSDQLDVIKSLANCTQTVHVLLGTYELLAFRNLSGQLSRRSIVIDFPRYRADDPQDRKVFQTILRSFERQLPVPEPPDLMSHWEYLYERSIGCVGILKDWLMRALAVAVKQNRATLTVRDLHAQELSAIQCDKILSEALEGEMALNEEPAARTRLRTRLGLSCREDGQPIRPKAETTPMRKGRIKPGQRHPTRDPVGQPLAIHATIQAL